MRTIWLIVAAGGLLVPRSEADEHTKAGLQFELSYRPIASSPDQSLTGRMFLLISRTNHPEVRLQSHWYNSPEILGVDVQALKPGQVVIIDGSVPGSPLSSLREVPPGDYFVQAVLDVYAPYQRADGRTVWAHRDAWEGHNFARGAGNPLSAVTSVHLDPSASVRIPLQLDQTIAATAVPADTLWVHRVRIRSALLSHFWGHPIELGAVVLLPRGYDAHPRDRYPVLYHPAGHYSLAAPFDFTTDPVVEEAEARQDRESTGAEDGYRFFQAWSSVDFPRVIAVAFQHPTPFSDMSGVTDSANNGPYDQAILTELIPYLESQFRIQREPKARVLMGKASGARDALALQLRHPKFFGGTWAFYPWAFDFTTYFGLNIYEESNAFTIGSAEIPQWARNPSGWVTPERVMARSSEGVSLATFRDLARLDAVLGGHFPAGEFGTDDAMLSPVGPLGYPRPLFDRRTGQIDPEVAQAWREQGDLAQYLRSHWASVAPDLEGKLHVYVGDLDHFHRNFGVQRLQAFLADSANPHVTAEFRYGLFRGDYQPMTNAELVRIVARYIATRGAGRSSEVGDAKEKP